MRAEVHQDGGLATDDAAKSVLVVRHKITVEERAETCEQLAGAR